MPSLLTFIFAELAPFAAQSDLESALEALDEFGGAGRHWESSFVVNGFQRICVGWIDRGGKAACTAMWRPWNALNILISKTEKYF